MTELNELRLRDYLGHMRLAIGRIKEYVDGHSETPCCKMLLSGILKYWAKLQTTS
jgi:hypothetical protein